MLNPVAANLGFCADASRLAAENPIGSASIHHTYVLVECPPPWEYGAFHSAPIPAQLRALPDHLYAAGYSVRFLLIYNAKRAQPGQHRLLIFQRRDGWQRGYDQWTFQVESLAAMPDLIMSHLEAPAQPPLPTPQRHLLVCTHGSHDYCCARYGKPFYHKAQSLIEQLGLSEVWLWETSHFGGHRFAPTVIDLPSGRYYGALDAAGLAAILQQGDLTVWNRMYRGWGLLPEAAQVLEQALIQQWGWAWFDNQVWIPAPVTVLSETMQQTEIYYRCPAGRVGAYRGLLQQDADQTVQLRGSCTTEKVSTFIKWRLTDVQSLAPEAIVIA